MALKLVIKDVVHYENMTQSATGTTKKDVELKTDKQTSSLILQNTSKSKQTYNLSILNLNYQKKMYQPTEVIVSILFSTINTNNQDEAWIVVDGNSRVDFDEKDLGENEKSQCDGAGSEDFPDIIEARITQHTIVCPADQESNQIDKRNEPSLFPINGNIW